MAAVHALVCAHRGDERLLEAVLGVVGADHRAQEGEHRPAVLVQEPLKRRLLGGVLLLSMALNGSYLETTVRAYS